MKVLHVAGARPNFMKIAPLMRELKGRGVEAPICKASGIGRVYDLGLTCGLGEYTEVNDIVTGITDYTIGDTTYVVFPTSGADAGPGEITGGLGLIKGHPIAVISSTSNWRQE